MKMGLTMLIKTEFSEFCKTTSMKGIPRAVNAKSKLFSFMWIIGVLLLLGLAFFQVIQLVMEFLAHPTVSVETVKAFHPGNQNPNLPTFTICNQNPFASNMESPNIDVMTLKEYYRAVDDLTTEGGLNVSDDSPDYTELLHFKRLLKTPKAYFQTIGHRAARTLGHRRKNFIVDCKEIIYMGLGLEERNCSANTKIELVQSVDYFNCYKVSYPQGKDRHRNGIVAGRAFVLYLDNVSPHESSASFSKLARENFHVSGYGAIATPHQPNSHGFPVTDGYTLAAGMTTTLQFSETTHKHLEAPYGSCVPSEFHGYEGLKMCLATCLHEEISAKCQCVFADNDMFLDEPDLPFCLRLSGADFNDSIYKCALSVMAGSRLSYCLDHCPPTCLEYDYTIWPTYSPWPTSNSLATFYSRYIKNRNYEKHFEMVKNLTEGNYDNDTDEAVMYLLSRQLINDNFLQVKYYLSDIR